MKIKKYNKFLVSIILTVFYLYPLTAQEKGEPEKMSPYMEFKYLKNTEEQRILDAKIFLAGELGIIPVEGLPVRFYTNMEEPE